MTEPRKSREEARRRVAKKNAMQNEMADPFALFDEEDEWEAELTAEPTPEPTPEPDPELEELRAFKRQTEAEKREAAIAEKFSEVGLPPKAAKLYAALNPEGDVTAKAVEEFGKEYGLPTGQRGYTPTLLPGEAPTPKKISRTKMEEIARTNPARAQKLAEAGRVRWNNPEIGGAR